MAAPPGRAHRAAGGMPGAWRQAAVVIGESGAAGRDQRSGLAGGSPKDNPADQARGGQTRIVSDAAQRGRETSLELL